MKNRLVAAIEILALVESEKGTVARSWYLGACARLQPAAVRRLFRDLASARLITVRRGAQGGAVLTRDPARMTLADVFDAIGGATLVRPRLDAANTFESREVAILWSAAAEDAVSAFRLRLAAVTLADVIKSAREARRKQYDANRQRPP